MGLHDGVSALTGRDITDLAVSLPCKDTAGSCLLKSRSGALPEPKILAPDL